MFFVASKLFWPLLEPGTLLVLGMAIATAGLYTRWSRRSRLFLAVSLSLFVFLSVGPTGKLLLQPLENRFPRPAENLSNPGGIIVLGGGVDEVVSGERDTLKLTDAGSRMVEAVALMRRFPEARLVFSGGSAALLDHRWTETDVARRLFLVLGIAPERMAFEDRSRNTWENAVLTRDLVQPQPGENWLLVTSAFHMPRAVGAFRKVGFTVTPYPVDYQTGATIAGLLNNPTDFATGLQRSERALREYLGLLAYRLTGRTESLFPAPN